MSEGTIAAPDARSLLMSDGTDRSVYLGLRTRTCHDRPLKAGVEEVVRELADESSELSKSVTASKASLKRGIALWVLGKSREAEQALGAAVSTADSNYFRALCCLELGYDARALTFADRAYASDPADTDAALLVAEAKIKLGDLDAGLALLDKLAKNESLAADVQYLRGLAGDLSGQYAAAAEAYQKALEIDPGALKAKFRLAYNASLAGDDTGAIQLYEQILEQNYSFTGALMNLGILYEDKGRYQDAALCFERVHKVRPGERRARLYQREAVASLDTIVDDDLQKEVQKRLEILQIPISDFELSVRSRNCLAKMQIRTLGDLVQKTEQDLLGYKNFGETSLTEIRDILNSKGLRLGMFEEESMDEVTRRVLAATRQVEKESSLDILKHMIEELELSLRSRRCLEALGVKTVGDLAAKTKDELMTARNFGRTSLKEVRERLAASGLSLKDETPGVVEQEE